MKTKNLIACLALTLFATAGLAQNALTDKAKDAAKQAEQAAKDAADAAKKAAEKAAQPGDKKAEAPAGDPAMDEMMKLGEPGEMHKHLEKAAGEWDAKTKMWMAPGMAPEESTGKAVFRSMLGGRFVQMQYSGTMMGGPFRGFAIYGYDNATKKFESVWIDSFSTGMMKGTGELAADKKTMTWTVESTGPDGKKETMREVETFVDDNTTKFEMFSKNPSDGKEFLMMEINYTRGKGVDKGEKGTDKPAATAPAGSKPLAPTAIKPAAPAAPVAPATPTNPT